MSEDKDGVNQSGEPITAEKVFREVRDYIQKQPKDKPRMPVLYVANYQAIRKFQIIELNKLTLLFGPNSAGKSVIADALEDLANQLTGKGVPSTRYHWNMLEPEDDSHPENWDQMVLGIGGLTTDEISGWHWKGYGLMSDFNDLYWHHHRDIYTKIDGFFPSGSSDVLVTFCPDGRCRATCGIPHRVFFWKGGKHIARFDLGAESRWSDESWERNRPVIYGGDKLHQFMENQSYYQLELADPNDPEDARIDTVPFDEDGITDHHHDLEGIDFEGPDDPYYHSDDEGIRYKYVGTKSVARSLYSIGSDYEGPDKNGDTGALINYFLVEYAHSFADELYYTHRLGPLRIIPRQNNLNFNISFRWTERGVPTSNPWYFCDGTCISPGMYKEFDAFDAENGIRCWYLLARDFIYRFNWESEGEHLLLDEINLWLKDRFNSNLEISGKTTVSAVQDLPIEKGTKPFDELGFNFSFQVQLAFRSIQTGKDIYPSDVGVGMSQLVPVLVSALTDAKLFIEQPELHLHPAHQLIIADLLVDRLNKRRAYAESNDWLVAETHSEHIILRLLRRIAESSDKGDDNLSPEEITVYYAVPSEDGTVFEKLEISDDGDFKDEWPNGFFDERDKELFY